jgi:hypothetical protein
MHTTALTIPVVEARQAELRAQAARYRSARRNRPEAASTGVAPATQGCTQLPRPRAA